MPCVAASRESAAFFSSSEPGLGSVVAADTAGAPVTTRAATTAVAAAMAVARPRRTLGWEWVERCIKGPVLCAQRFPGGGLGWWVNGLTLRSMFWMRQ